MGEEVTGGIMCGDGGCQPVSKEFAEQLWADAQGRQRTRAANMPTEQKAIEALFEAWYRLKELGWSEASYVPRDGTPCEFIECGSTGVHKGHADEEGRIWIEDAGDLWPSKPVLFRKVIEPSSARREG